MIAIATQFKLNRPWSFPRFLWLTVMSAIQAWNDPNCLMFRIKLTGFKTMSTWKDADSMKRYALSGHHYTAMNESKSLGHGSCVRWQTENKPTWRDAIRRLSEC